MRGAAALVILPLIAGCQPRSASPPLDGVVSIDFCADQMALGLLPKGRIKAVSFEADSDASFSAPRATGIARIRPQLEDIVRLHPAVVVRSYGGGARLDRQLEAIGIRVVQLGFPNTLAEVRADMLRVGNALAASDKAKERIAAFDAQIENARGARPKVPAPSALYVTPGDVTTGPGSLVAEVMRAAGTHPYRRMPGWGSLPLEEMVRRPPDMVFRAFFDSTRYRQDHWAASRHPITMMATQKARQVEVPGSWLACGNWLTGNAVDALAAKRKGTHTS